MALDGSFANASSLEKVNKMLDDLIVKIGQPNENGNHPFLSEDGVFRLSANIDEVKATVETLFKDPTLLLTNNLNQKPILAAHVMKNAVKDDRVKIDPKASQIFKDLVEEYAALPREAQDANGGFYKVLIDRLIQNNLLEEAKLVHNLLNLSHLVVKQDQFDRKEKSLRKSQMTTDAISKIIIPNLIHRFIDSDPITEINTQNKTIAMMMRTIDKSAAENNAAFTKRFDVERPNEASTLAKHYEKLSQEPPKAESPTVSSVTPTVSADTKKPSLFSRAVSWLKESGKKVLNFFKGLFSKKEKAKGPTPMEHLDQVTKNEDSVPLDVSLQKDRVKGPAGRRLPTRNRGGQTEAPTVNPVKVEAPTVTPVKVSAKLPDEIGPPTTPPPPPPISLEVGPPLTPPPPPPDQNPKIDAKPEVITPNTGRPLPMTPVITQNTGRPLPTLPVKPQTQAEIQTQVEQQLKEAERFGGEQGGIVAERKKDLEKANRPPIPERRPPSVISAPEIHEGGVNVKKLKDMFEKNDQQKGKKSEEDNSAKPKSNK
jgi:hypothetical protein